MVAKQRSAEVQPVSKKVFVNGINIHYLDWGGKGQPMVLLHATAGFAHIWDFMARPLQPYYHILALDQRGAGDSDKPKTGYAAEDYAADLDAFLKKLGLEKVILVGHSLGSRVGMVFAGQHPEKVSHLIMVAGPHYVSMVPSDTKERNFFDNVIREFDARPTTFHSTQEVIDQFREPTSYYRFLSDEMLQFLITYNMYHKADGTLEFKWNKSAAVETLKHIPDDLKPYVKRITCPILCPIGKREVDLTPDKVPLIQSLFPTAKWVSIEKGEYFIYLENPQALAKAIHDFIPT